jgi:PleD family two-component response regulator
VLTLSVMDRPLPKTGNGWRVLVVDDDVLSQLIAIRMLEKHGYAVSVVRDGREAVAALEKHPFHIVLIECQKWTATMPPRKFVIGRS